MLVDSFGARCEDRPSRDDSCMVVRVSVGEVVRSDHGEKASWEADESKRNVCEVLIGMVPVVARDYGVSAPQDCRSDREETERERERENRSTLEDNTGGKRDSGRILAERVRVFARGKRIAFAV